MFCSRFKLLYSTKASTFKFWRIFVEHKYTNTNTSMTQWEFPSTFNKNAYKESRTTRGADKNCIFEGELDILLPFDIIFIKIRLAESAEETTTPKTGGEDDPLMEERLGNARDVGNLAVWSLSSCKPGFGVERLRDNTMDTYWQSDGQLPHLVNIQFHRKTNISQIYIYTDYKLDESYTPSRISIRSGSHFNDLQELQIIDLNEPTGWVGIPIKDGNVKSIRTFMLQIAVISNHQNGRDTHMRQIRIHAPVEGKHYPLETFGKFSTVGFRKYATSR